MKKQKLEEINKRILDDYKEKEIVLGDGSHDSTIVLIGEAPGAKEVEAKKPFVGQAGKHLQEFLEILGLDRNELYITNTVKFRPTKKSSKTGGDINRPPSKKEIEDFKKYLFDEIDTIKPKVIVTLGNVPLKTVTKDENVKIGDFHGKSSTVMINDSEYNLFPLYHPAAVIYRRELKEVYHEDLKILEDFLNRE